MAPRRPSPAQRVRDRLLPKLGPKRVAQLPEGYQRLGRVVLLRLPEELRPYFDAIAEVWMSELGVGAVLRRAGAASGELRVPTVELLAGRSTRTEVIEYGVRYGFDAARVLFARGNRAERHRFGTVVRPGETVTDLFAGIGYFTLPAALTGHAGHVWAVEKNPESFRFLVENVRRNHVDARVTCLRGDNREVDLPDRAFDRIVMGYLPSSLPWVDRAVGLLRPSGGTLHLHFLVGRRDGTAEAVRLAQGAVERLGAEVRDGAARVVKSYGPGRDHVVVDLVVVPDSGV